MISDEEILRTHAKQQYYSLVIKSVLIFIIDLLVSEHLYNNAIVFLLFAFFIV